MGIVLSIDLAFKMSAYTLLEDQVLQQGDSWGEGRKTHTEFVYELAWVVKEFEPEVILIEDLPHHIRFMPNTKGTARLQGRIEQQLATFDVLDRILWIPPVLWKASYKLNGKDTAKLIEPKALELYGYEAPIDYTKYHYKQRTAARKIRTDYAAAYLIGRWAQETKASRGTYDVETTQRSHDG